MSNTLSKVAFKSITIGTRGSALALWQAKHVASVLKKGGCVSRLEVIVTSGDRRLETPIPELGDKGVFTAELDAALIERRIDLAVHSLKDLPTEFPVGLALVAVLDRAEPWDILVARDPHVTAIEDLPTGAILGTSSLRRSAQLLAWRDDLKVVPVRGNVETRIRKLETEHLDGVILAEAGVRRLGLEERISSRFSPSVILPAVGQGAIGIVAASDRTDIAEMAVSLLNHGPTQTAVRAERAFLLQLEGGCQVPAGAYAHLDSEGRIHLSGCVATLDGTTILRDDISGSATDSESLGIILARRLLDRGADKILAEIRQSEANDRL